MGSSVHAQYFYPDLASPNFLTADAVVGSGAEFQIFARTWDLTDTQITTTFTESGWFATAPFNGIVFSDLMDNLASIVGVTIDAATNLNGFTASNVGFDANSISINYVSNGVGLTFTPGDQVVLNVQFAQTVPEPGSLLLVAAALAAAAGLRQRRAA